MSSNLHVDSLIHYVMMPWNDRVGDGYTNPKKNN